MEPKRLYRSIADRKIAGVAGGLADYFDLDPLLIRLIFVILAVSGGVGIPIYLVLWIVTPEKNNWVKPSADQQNREDWQPSPGSQVNNGDIPGQEFTSSAANQAGPQPKERHNGSLIGGLVLITLGVLFLAVELIPELNFGDLWPVILVVVGIGLLLNGLTGKKRNINQY